MKVLVVDDDPAILELLRFELGLAGYEVVPAKDGEEFRRAAGRGPDLIVLDIMLGDENGAIIYHDLVAAGSLEPTVPVIFLTALAQDRPETPAAPGRSVALHSKPFDADKLVGEIRQLMTS